MKVIDNIRSLNTKQKNELKRKARMVYTNILSQAVVSFILIYGALAIMDSF